MTTEEWPPELEAAFSSRWNEWLQSELQKQQGHTTPTAPLYHYTGRDAAEGILRNERLWCFSHLHQTDRTEFSYSLGVAREIIKKICRSEDWFKKNFAVCLDDLLENNSFTDIFEFYLFSLSRHRDDAGQWDEYAQSGTGFAIGFAPSLFQPDQPKPYDEANKNIWVARVQYGNDATGKLHRRAIERAAVIASECGYANEAAIRKIKPSVYFPRIAKEVIASPLIFNCLSTKKRKYHNEKEVRYISLNLRAKYDTARKVHDGRNYIEVELPLRKPGSVTEILVGPNAPAGTGNTLREFLNSQGYPESIPIRPSRV